MILLLLCFLPLLSAENISSTTFTPKHVHSGDLPEDYHMATVATEVIDHHSLKTTTTIEDYGASTTEYVPVESLAPKNNTSETQATSSDVAVSRSFTIDSSDPELNEDGTEAQPTSTIKPENSTKPHKLKKKILISRPKSEKIFVESLRPNGTNSSFNQTDSDLKKRSDETFYSFSSSTTEISNDGKHQTTSSLLITGIENNNLLNVIETSEKSTTSDATDTYVDRSAGKNTIRFDSFDPTGQTDWVPLVSKKAEWAPFFPSTTTDNNAATTTMRRRRPSSTLRPLIRFPDQVKAMDENGTTVEPISNETTTEMDVAVWALATSQLTRRPINSTNVEQVSFVSPPNNTLYKKIKENIELRVTTDKPNNENVTKEHNQVLKNTIPDSVIVETTPSIPKWRPVVTIAPSTSTTAKSENLTHSNDVLANVTTDSVEDTTDVERTIAYEIMKITTVLPPNTTTSSGVDKKDEYRVIVVNTTELPVEITEINETSTETLENITAVPVVEKIQEMPENITEKASHAFEPITTKIADEEYLTTTLESITTTDAEMDTTEVVPEKKEKLDDENRTVQNNETTIDRPIIEEITEENVPAYLRLTVETSEIGLCHLLPDLRESIIKILSEGTNTSVNPEWLVLLNLNPTICRPVLRNERPKDSQVRQRPVNMFLMDQDGCFNKNLSEAFLRLWGEAGLNFPLPILKVDFVTPIPEGVAEPDMSGGVIAAIVISCVAGLCLILLGVLFVIMKRRQKKFNYGQRCTPVSLDAYSLDSVSIRNSSRRKGIRASKRSYGNAAFDDSEVPSHPVNFAGLANFSLEKDQMHEEFSVIPQVAPRPDELPPGAENRNRYANVIPLPETRVVLSLRDGEPHSDYINANFIKGLNSSDNLYVAAQAPMDNTLGDWWRMVWEQQIKVILMLTALQENGVEKCADYLPPNEVTDNLRLFGDFQVTLKKRDVKDKYIVSTLQLKNMENNLWREVTHLWYIGWPDSGVPAEPNSLIAFLIEARSQLKSSSGVPAPTLVHCSPGTGRTGTVIACDMLIREFEQKRLVDIPRAVYHLRRSRAGAVQTRDQYAFIYQVLNTYATKLTGGALETI